MNLHVHKRVAFTYGTRSNVYSCNAAASWATHIYIRWFIAYIWHLFAFNVFYIESFVFDFKYTRSFRRHLKCTNIKLSWTECSTVFMLFLFFSCFFVRRAWIWIKLRFLSLYERNGLCHWSACSALLRINDLIYLESQSSSHFPINFFSWIAFLSIYSSVEMWSYK